MSRRIARISARMALRTRTVSRVAHEHVYRRQRRPQSEIVLVRALPAVAAAEYRNPPLWLTLILALHRRHLTVRGRRFGRRIGIISSLPFVRRLDINRRQTPNSKTLLVAFRDPTKPHGVDQIFTLKLADSPTRGYEQQYSQLRVANIFARFFIPLRGLGWNRMPRDQP
jgi:hypothetical protein